jgi:putative endonuclease
MQFHVYILFSEKLNKYYTGQTNNLEDRIFRHNAAQESFTASGVPWKLVWSMILDTRVEAITLEKKIKKKRCKKIFERYGHWRLAHHALGREGCKFNAATPTLKRR